MNPQIPRGQSSMQPNLLPRHYPPRPRSNFPAPRPYLNQFNRGPPLHSRNNSPFFNQQYPRRNYQNSSNTFSNRPYSNSHQPPNQTGTSSYSPKPPCQICGRTNHMAIDYYHRMDYVFQGRNPQSQLAAMAAHSNSAYEEQQ